MKDNLDQVLEQLRPEILSVKRCAPDLHPDVSIEFADDQTILHTGVIYLVSQPQAQEFLSNVSVQPGAYLMVSDATETGSISRLPECDRITVIEFRCRAATLYNRLTRILAQCFCAPDSLGDSRNDMDQQEQLRHFWRQVRSRSLQGTLEREEQLRQICRDTKPYIRLMVVVSDELIPRKDWATPLQELQLALPESHLFFSDETVDGQIIGFQFFERQNFGALETPDTLQAILDNYHLRMMLSNSTRDFGKLNTLYSLTRRAGLIAERLAVQPTERIYHYERYGMYQVIDLCTQRYMSLFNHSDILYLVHPIVVHLTRYDGKHGTNLRDVLFYYLQNSQDLKHTAEMLYMHRNTVSNKINQIRSICHIDFEDGGLCQRLLFSCQVMLYYERVLHQNLSRNEESRRS